MTASYTFDVFSTLDGYGSCVPDADWGGYWGKQGPELLARRREIYSTPQRMVFGPATFRQFIEVLGPGPDAPPPDDWNLLMRSMPTTVVSSTLEPPFDWPDATVARGDGVDIVSRLKGESDVPLRSHGSLTLNWALLAAGLVDRVQVTVFPVVSARTGTDPVFRDAGDLDLELVEARTLDGRTQELIYTPHVHG